MARTCKIAVVGHQWNRIDARLLAGAFRQIEAHPNAVIRAFNMSSDHTALMKKLVNWGAMGIIGSFLEDDLQGLKGAMKQPIPIVTVACSSIIPGVVSVLSSANVWITTAVDHLRQLGIRYFGFFSTVKSPAVEERIIRPFLKITKPNTSSLVFPLRHEVLLNLELEKIHEVPIPLATWLRTIPKPCGVVANDNGAGPYLIRCCEILGLKVPEEIAVIGADDTDLSLSCTPTLTSVVTNMEILGSESARLLLGMIEGVQPPTAINRINAVDLFVRESTGQRRQDVCNIAGALEYIRVNATKGLSVTQLMRETQRTSSPTFYHHFREATGKSPAQAIRDRQLEEVRRLLTTTQLPVATISEMTGFSSSNVLARLFQKVEGMTPMGYRKSRAKDKG